MQATSSNPILSSIPPLAAFPMPSVQRGRETAPPSAPTLLATRLQLELLLSSRSPSAGVDLREAAGIILNDLGATLEVFRLAGEECCEGWESGGVASRLEDCLASLGTEVWLDAVCANAVERTDAGTHGRTSELAAFWEHGRAVAYACWLLAEHQEGVCPEEAYLVGLLHEVGRLPELLGWTPAQFGGTGALWTGSTLGLLAKHWRLPLYLERVVVAPEAPSTRWRRLLEAAHAWSRRDAFPLSSIA